MALIFDGRHVETTAHVIDWRSHGLEFRAGMKGVGKRKKAPRLGIIHYSGGENPPPTIYKTLVQRGLSCEFAMDLHGTIYQFADPAKVFCAHCQGMNTVSFGIEVQNRGLAGLPKSASPALKRVWERWGREVLRGGYRANLVTPAKRAGIEPALESVSYAMFTADQLSALVAFFTSLADAGVIPAKIPSKFEYRFGLNTKAVQGFEGVAGHYHFDADKLDPGPQVFEELLDEGFTRTRV